MIFAKKGVCLLFMMCKLAGSCFGRQSSCTQLKCLYKPIKILSKPGNRGWLLGIYMIFVLLERFLIVVVFNVFGIVEIGCITLEFSEALAGKMCPVEAGLKERSDVMCTWIF